MNYFWDNRGGFLVAFAALVAACLLLNWIAWIFRWGRFAQTRVAAAPTQPLRFLAGNFFVEIINDFRHFLALVMVLLFAVALFVAMYPGLVAGEIEAIKDGVQAVAAALGGLIGSIIGYYFGESAASKGAQTTPLPAVGDTRTPVQQPPPDDEPISDIVPAPKLPGGEE
jgi:hypothetical protein